MAWDSDLSRHDRGYGHDWDKLRKTILKRDRWLCQQCLRNGRVTPLMVRPYDHAVDHITPKAHGGTDDPDNLQSLCNPCHKSKSDADEARNASKLHRADGWRP